MTISKPTFPEAAIPEGETSFKYLASSGLTPAILKHVCIKEAEVVGVSGLNTVDVKYRGVDYLDVPVWIHTDAGSRAKLAGGAPESASAEPYFYHSALLFPFQQGFIYHIYGENPPVDHVVTQQIVLVMVYTDPDTLAISILGVVRVILGPTGLEKFALGLYYDNVPAETYRPVIEVCVRDSTSHVFEYSLWDVVDQAPVCVPSRTDGELSLPFFQAVGIEADDPVGMTAIQAFLWGSLFDATPPAITIDANDYGDAAPWFGGVSSHSGIANAGTGTHCINADGSTGALTYTCDPVDCSFNLINVEWWPDNPYAADPQSFDRVWYNVYNSPCYGMEFETYSIHHHHYKTGAETWLTRLERVQNYSGPVIRSGGDIRLYSNVSGSASTVCVATDSNDDEVWRYTRETSCNGEAQIIETYFIMDPFEQLPAPYGDGGSCQTNWTVSRDLGGDSQTVSLQTSGASFAATGHSEVESTWDGDLLCYQWQNMQDAISPLYADKTFIWNGWAVHSVNAVVTTTFADDDYFTPNPLTADSFDVTVFQDSGSLPNGSTARTLISADALPQSFANFVTTRVRETIVNHIDEMQNQSVYIRPQYTLYYVPYDLPTGKLYEGLETKTC